MDNIKLIIKEGGELTTEEIDRINQAKNREWQTPPMTKEHLDLHLFFLLKNESGEILAQGQLVKIEEAKFSDERLNILGIGGIIASQKGQGYGKRLMEGIKDFLIKGDFIGLGFTGDDIIEFYQKSCFIKNKVILKRFVFMDGDQKVTNLTEDWAFYLDNSQKIIQRMIDNPGSEIVLPRRPDW